MSDTPPKLPSSPASERPSRLPKSAIWSLVLGILSNLILWVFGSIPAIILGIIGIQRANQSPGIAKGKGVAMAGIITGSLGIIVGFVPFGAIVSIYLISGFMGNQMENYQGMADRLLRLEVVVQACTDYSEDHNGAFPASLDELVSGGYLASRDDLIWNPEESEPAKRPWIEHFFSSRRTLCCRSGNDDVDAASWAGERGSNCDP